MAKPSARHPDAMDAFVGARIALRRAALGLSQSVVGTRLGISFQQVQKYETGANRVSASRLHAIAGVLGTSVADFFPPPGVLAEPQGPDERASLRLIASPEGRSVAGGFPLIADRDVRRAVARIVEALAEPP